MRLGNARREKKKGRTKGEFIIAKRKGWAQVGEAIVINRKRDNIIQYKVQKRGRNLVIVSICNTKNQEDMEDRSRKMIEEHKSEYIVIRSDNAKIGEEGGNGGERWNIKRCSKDTIINSRGRNRTNRFSRRDRGYNS